LRKDKRQTCKKVGIRWAQHSGRDTQQPSPPPGEFIIYSGKPGSRVTVLEDHDIVGIWNRGNLLSLLSACKHLTKSSCAAFCSRPLLQLGTVPSPACRLFDIAVLTPFCSCELCETQPAGMAVLLSGSHRFLTLHSPQTELSAEC
jgi:hypothetical protein